MKNYEIIDYISKLSESKEEPDFEKIRNDILSIARKYPDVPNRITHEIIALVINHTLTARAIIDPENPEEERLGIYHDGIYDIDPSTLDSIVLQLNSHMTLTDISWIRKILIRMCDKAVRTCDPYLIAVNNGIFDFKTKEFMPFDPKYVFLSKACTDYNPDIKLKVFNDGWNVDDWLKEISYDKDTMQLLWHVIGSVLRPYVRYDKIVWLHARKALSGAGSFCNLLQNLVGKNACLNASVSDFDKDSDRRRALILMQNKQAVICDENNFDLHDADMNTFKDIAFGEIIYIRNEFRPPAKLRFHGIMIQAVQNVPEGLSDEAQIIVPFDHTFEGHMNTNIQSKYVKDKEVLEYVLYKVLHMDTYDLDVPKSVTDLYH